MPSGPFVILFSFAKVLLPLLLKLLLKLLLSCFKYVQLCAYSAYQSKSAINPTLLLPFKRDLAVTWERSKCPPPPRFGDEILPRRRRRLEKERSTTTRDDFDERREENLTLLETKARKKKRRANAFSLSKSLSLAGENHHGRRTGGRVPACVQK